MNNFIRLGILTSYLVLFLVILFSQNSNIDLPGYQEFIWGMSNKAVVTLLRNSGATIKSIRKERIIINSKIELEEYPSSVNITKVFNFSNNSLYSVVLDYLSSSNAGYRADSIFFKFVRQLQNKYGNAYYDTTDISDKIVFRSSEWRFSKGDIMIESRELPNSYEDLPPELISLMKESIVGVRIYYFKKANEKEMLENKKRISKQF